MRSLRRVLYWFVAGFLFCPWEGPTRTFGMTPLKFEHLVAAGGFVQQDAYDPRNPLWLSPAPDPGFCPPPTDSSPPMGLHGYRRYFANDSLIGRPVPCTREDKICFRHNLVFDPVTDRCKALWESCAGATLTVVNRTELEHGSGRAVGSCSENNTQCSGYIMAYDGISYEKKIVHNVICGRDAKPTRHILGGMECRVMSASPINVQQPEDDGSCAIPDLNNPDPRLSMLLDDLFQLEKQLECTSNQSACFSEGKVFVAGSDGCHTLLERGPCAEDHVVVLDFHADAQGRAEGSCVHVRGGCPKGYKRMLFDGQCHEDREIAIVAPGKIFVDGFGRYIVNNWAKNVFFNPVLTATQRCILSLEAPLIFPIPESFLKTTSPPCDSDHSDKCKIYNVENDPPEPDF